MLMDNDFHLSTQVAVVGGGTAGTVAAISAARTGAQVTLIESESWLGGCATGGLVNSYLTFHDSEGKRVIGGIAQEIVDKLSTLGATTGHVPETRGDCATVTLFDSNILKLVLLELCMQAGVNILYRTHCIGVKTDKGRISSLILSNKSGIGTLDARTIVDSTGDADVVSMGGYPYEKSSETDLQPITLMLRVAHINISAFLEYVRSHPDQFLLGVPAKELNERSLNCMTLSRFPPYKQAIMEGRLPKGISGDQGWLIFWKREENYQEATVNIARIDSVDGTNGVALSNGQCQLQLQILPILQFLKGNVPGFNKLKLVEIAPYPGVRETRRCIGKYVVTEEDVLKGRSFEDAIGLAATPIDVHGGSEAKGQMFWIKTESKGVRAYQIPYRCLLPKTDGNLIVAGRCVSATHKAAGAMRMMPVCMVTGQAAGVASALSILKNKDPYGLNVVDIQNSLINQNHIVRLAERR